MAPAIPKAYLASSAIRCRDVETGPTLGVLAVFPSTGVRSNYSIGLQTVVVADGYPGSEGVGSAAQPRRRGGSPRWRSRSAPKAHLKSTDVGAV